MSDSPDTDVIDNPARHRFELTIEGHTAVIDYEPMEGGLVFAHTIVPPELEGRGVGGRLVKAALGVMRERGLKVRPDCPFVASYIGRHPEYADLVAG